MSQRRCCLVALCFVMCGLTGCGGSSASPSSSPLKDCRGSNAPFPANRSQGPVHYASLTVDRELRGYRLFEPPSITQASSIPLVIAVHGGPSNADQWASITGLDAEASAAGFLLAYPNGCNGFWFDMSGNPKATDIDFIRAVIDRLESQFRVDRNRLFVVGASGGSVMAYQLACDPSTRIAALASVSGTMLSPGDCKPARPVSILEMHGTDDAQLPWDGGGPHNAISVDDLIKRWRANDGCNGDPVVSESGITQTSIWKNCQSGTVVRLDKVVGGHHTWFGSTVPPTDPVPGEPDANAVIWNFFSGLKPAA